MTEIGHSLLGVDLSKEDLVHLRDMFDSHGWGIMQNMLRALRIEKVQVLVNSSEDDNLCRGCIQTIDMLIASDTSDGTISDAVNDELSRIRESEISG